MSTFELPPLRNWQDFEDLCCDLWRRLWNDSETQKNGRSGDPQEGVDIFGRPGRGREWVGVQCKHKARLVGGKLSRSEIEQEVEKARKFRPPLSRFLIATTAPRSATIQEAAREITAAQLRQDSFSVRVVFWEDILEDLTTFPDLIAKYYPGFDRSIATKLVPHPPSLWSEPPTELSVFHLMSWRTRLTSLYGRDHEIDQLLHWVRASGEVPRVRVITGSGGAGKSRFAAEVCDKLWKDNWDARFIELDNQFPTAVEGFGALWVVDYPEEKQKRLRLFLQHLRENWWMLRPIRVLMLSRQPIEWWKEQTDLRAAHSGHLFDTFDLKIAGLSADDTVAMFQETCRSVGRLYGFPVPELTHDLIVEWRRSDVDLHSLPLFITATAIHAVVDQDRGLSLNGKQVVQSLVERERERLDAIGREVAQSQGFGQVAPNWVSRLRGLAAVVNGLTPPILQRLAVEKLQMRLPPPEAVVDIASRLPFWSSTSSSIEAVRPDIFAAALLLSILRERSDVAPEWLWATIEDEAANSSSDLLDRIARIVYDVSTVADQEQPVTKWFVQMIEADSTRAQKLSWIMEEERPPDPVLPLTLAIGSSLVRAIDQPSGVRAATLCNYAIHLLRSGRNAEALPFFREAVELFKQLSEADPTYQPGHARALRGLGSALEGWESLSAIEVLSEAVAILRRLLQSPDHIGDSSLLHALASALNNCGIAMSAVGHRNDAEQAFREAIDLYRNLITDYLPAAQRRVYEDAMARGLHNLADLLYKSNRTGQALETIRKAVDIRRRLLDECPWRYARYLAMSLGALIGCLKQEGLVEEAINTVDDLITIRRTLMHANPSQFASELAASLGTRVSLLESANRRAEALREALALIQLYIELYQSSASLTDILNYLRISIHWAGSVGSSAVALDLPDLAIKACTIGINLLEGIRSEKQALWSANLQHALAGAYFNRADALRISDRSMSINDYKHSIEILDDFLERFGFRGEVAVARTICLTNLTSEQLKEDQREAGLRNWEAACRSEWSSVEKLGGKWPLEKHWQWINSLYVLEEAALIDRNWALAGSVMEQLVNLCDAFRSKGGENLRRVSNVLVHCGDFFMRLGQKHASLACILEAVACAENFLAKYGERFTPAEEADLLNAIGYGLAIVTETTGASSSLLITEAERLLRRALQVLPNNDSDLQRISMLDSLGYILVLRAQQEHSTTLATEAAQLLNEALDYYLGRLNCDNQVLIVREHLNRALRIMP